MQPATPAWTPPAEFDEFRVLRYLGGGGMGHVWLAHDLVLDRPVAVKFLGGAESDAASAERVVAEARAAARVQHPNVAAVYRVGTLDRRPYIISEYVRGESLDRLPKPLPAARAVELGVGLGRGLMAAHRRGVLHRDLKPHNAILDEAGAVKLVDFGLAKLLDGEAALVALLPPRPAAPRPVEPAGRTPESSRGSAKVLVFDRKTVSLSGSVAGTPYYMAPELWRGEAATARSDLYALGALLYELVAGRTPFAGTPMPELPTVVGARPAPPLATFATEADPRLCALVDRCLMTNAADRPASADEVVEALAALGSDGATTVAVPRDANPYRGLMPFEAEHRALFFGRAREIRAVAERLRADRVVVVTGDSGAGKSSLCRAGVLPLVADGTQREGRRWSTTTMVPGRRPLRALTAALAEHADGDDEELERLCRDEPDAVARRLHKRLGRSAGLVVLVDQLEELVTSSAPADAAAFGRAVCALVDAGAAVRVLGAARGDFLARIAGVAELGDLLSRALYILSPLDEAATREAIVGPARLTGVAFESDALIATLVRATVGGQGGLPLLQFALAELWEARDRTRALITGAALEAIGGVGGALARHGDRVLATLLPDERQAARRVLLRMVTDEGTRARRSAAELTGGDPAAATALEALVRGRLVVARHGDEGAAYEVAHEALVSGWATLRGWIAAESDVRAARLRLEGAVAEWERLDHAPETLWSARQLDEIAALGGDALRPPERAFVAASMRAIRRARWRRGGAVLGVPLVVAAIFGGVKLHEQRRLDREIDGTLATVAADESAGQAAVALATARSRDAYAAFDAGQSDDGEARWRDARAAWADAERAYGRAAGKLEAALSLDGRRSDVRGRFADVLAARALVAEERGRSAEVDELVSRLAVYDAGGERTRRFHAPGRLTVTTTPPANVTLTAWSRDASGHRRAQPPRFVGAAPLTVELPPGSYVLGVDAPGHAPVRYPFVLARGEALAPSLTLPPSRAVPDGFLYVPPGRFLYGTADEALRAFDLTVPLHARTTGAFLIARHETTFAEWIEFLDALPPAERMRHRPRGAGNLHGTANLEPVAGGGWRLALKPSEQLYVARLGEPLVYRGRDRRAAQDWRRFPVVGVGWSDVEAYAAWLRRSGRVSGARPCREDEWERAARGADDRDFPHGDVLAPDDADFDETYGRNPVAFGPDEVGAHPASASPFGVDDLSGNVWEWTRGLGVASGAQVLRGGAYYYGAITNRSTNRQIVEPDMRDATLGVRICADAPP